MKFLLTDRITLSYFSYPHYHSVCCLHITTMHVWVCGYMGVSVYGYVGACCLYITNTCACVHVLSSHNHCVCAIFTKQLHVMLSFIPFPPAAGSRSRRSHPLDMVHSVTLQPNINTCSKKSYHFVYRNTVTVKIWL